jgi:hypothetical protein
VHSCPSTALQLPPKVGAEHVPTVAPAGIVQVPLQQLPLFRQTSPVWPHHEDGWHAPSAQLPEQQSPFCEQLLPSGRHVLPASCPQVPLVHVKLQQLEPLLHAPPLLVHGGRAQIWPLQYPAQHSLLVVQLLPRLRQLLPSPPKMLLSGSAFASLAVPPSPREPPSPGAMPSPTFPAPSTKPVSLPPIVSGVESIRPGPSAVESVVSGASPSALASATSLVVLPHAPIAKTPANADIAVTTNAHFDVLMVSPVCECDLRRQVTSRRSCIDVGAARRGHSSDHRGRPATVSPQVMSVQRFFVPHGTWPAASSTSNQPVPNARVVLTW